MLTSDQFNELFARVHRVGLGGDPAFRTRLVGRLAETNYDTSDPCFRRLSDTQFRAHAAPLADDVDRELALADRRSTY